MFHIRAAVGSVCGGEGVRVLFVNNTCSGPTEDEETLCYFNDLSLEEGSDASSRPPEESSTAIFERDGVMITQVLKSFAFKTFLIIGKTGTGKSSLCNRIVGHSPDSDIFPVSGGATSCTQSTVMGLAHFNGDKEKPLVNVIDTIGFDDPRNDTDVKIIAELVSKLKNNCDYVNLFGIAINGQAPRLDGSLVAMIKIFEEMFGQGFWKQCVLLFTKIPMNQSDKRRRAKHAKQGDDERAADYVKEVERMFPNSVGGLEYLFLDSCYEEECPEECAFFEESMKKLHKMLDAAPRLPTSTVNEQVQTENAKLRAAMEAEIRKYEGKIKSIQEETRREIQRVHEEGERKRKEDLTKFQSEADRKLQIQTETSQAAIKRVKEELEDQLKEVQEKAEREKAEMQKKAELNQEAVLRDIELKSQQEREDIQKKAKIEQEAVLRQIELKTQKVIEEANNNAEERIRAIEEELAAAKKAIEEEKCKKNKPKNTIWAKLWGTMKSAIVDDEQDPDSDQSES